MDNFFIITNRAKDKDMQVSLQIAEYLKNHGKNCIIQKAETENGTENFSYTDPDKIPEAAECLLVLGGDGTLIRAARDVVEKGIPLFGINLGTLGYLAEVDRNNIFNALDCLMNDAFFIERRMMLKGRVYRGKKFLGAGLALNDIVIARKEGLKVLQYNNYVNGAFLNTYRADGIIVATPTGSTGYSLSAGGPIISPAASLFLMTPLAPHTLNTRSVIFPAEDTITIELGPGREVENEKAMAYFDGDARIPLVTGDRVVITRAPQDTLILKIHHGSFLETLSRKMATV